MSWNHRVMKRSYTHKDGTIEYTYAIHEVYYDKEGNVDSYTEDSVAPQGETLEELEKEIELFKKAILKPVLNYEK